MRFKSMLFVFVISLSVIGVSDSHAGWVGTCNPAYIDCVNVLTLEVKTLETPCTLSDIPTSFDLNCRTAYGTNPIWGAEWRSEKPFFCHPSRISCYCATTGATNSFATTCSGLNQTQLNASCDTQYGASACPAPTYALTVQKAGTGGGTVSGAGNFLSGAAVSLTATPDANSEFSGWSPSPCAASFTMPGSALTCTATFTPKPTYALTVQKTGTGGGTVSGAGNFLSGAAVALTATPDANSVFAGWSPSPCAASFTMPGSALTCTATFTPKTYNLTFAVSSEIVVGVGAAGGTVSGGGSFAAGTPVTLTATPNANSVFSGWSSPCAASFTMPANDLMCFAEFNLKPIYALTVQKAGTGVGSVSGAGRFAAGMPVTLTATPDGTSEFAGWSPSPCAASFIMPESALTCTATFKKLSGGVSFDFYSLAVGKEGSGNGTVSGEGKYSEGTFVKPTATASTGSTFFGWRSSDPALDCAKGFNMPAKTVLCTAIFNKIAFVAIDGSGGTVPIYAFGSALVTAKAALPVKPAYELKVQTAPGTGKGTVSGAGKYQAGTSVNLTATPDAFSKFVRWSPSPCAASFKMPKSALTCTAIFESNIVDISYSTITVQTAGTGKGTVSGAGMYQAGTTVNLTATPADSNSEFAGWSPSPCAASFTMPDSLLTCTATFNTRTLRTLTLSDRHPYYGYGTGCGRMSGGGQYYAGSTVKLTVTPCSDSGFSGWSPSPCAASFIMPDNDLTCSGQFNKRMIVDGKRDYTTTDDTVQTEVHPMSRRDNAIIGGNAFMALVSEGNDYALVFRKPVSSVTLRISDYSGDTTLTAYSESGAVLKVVSVIGEALQSYTINNVGGILKVVASSSDAYVEDISYNTEIVPGDTDFDGDATLTDTIIMLRILAGADYSETIYPEISLNRTQIGPEDVIANLQKVAGLR